MSSTAKQGVKAPNVEESLQREEKNIKQIIVFCRTL